MYYDKDGNYMRDRDYWLKFIVGMMIFSYASKVYYREQRRSRRTARMDGYKDYPAHWFHNNGGVVVLKQFTGFRKYYKNGDEMMDWYKMVYPSKMKESSD